MSPSRTAAIGPPRAASGATWPAMKPVRRAREAAVGDERDRVAEARADERAGHGEHLAHAGAARRALVADDDDVAGWICAGVHRGERGLLAVEDARRPAVLEARRGRPPSPRSLGREVALEDDEAAGRLERVGERPHDLLARRLVAPRGLLADRPAGDGDARRACSSPASSRRCATSAMPPARYRSVATKRPPGLRSASSGTARADAIEVVDVERHAGLARDRQQVQHGVGRAAGGGDRRRSRSRTPSRVRICARPQVAARRRSIDERARRAGATSALSRIGGRHAAAAHRRDAEELARRSPSCWR